jgi:hypothetical protein
VSISQVRLGKVFEKFNINAFGTLHPDIFDQHTRYFYLISRHFLPKYKVMSTSNGDPCKGLE